MTDISVQELRNHGGEVVNRAARGEAITITHDGRAVAKLSSIGAGPVAAEVLLDRWRHVPRIDPERLRADIDEWPARAETTPGPKRKST